jgi:hypothetical protein
MQFVRSPRRTAWVVVITAAAFGAAIVGVSSASTVAGAVQRTVTAKLITRRAGTLAPGTVVRSSALGQRVFTDANHGFALANVAQAQYPAVTVDGGKVWKTDGPALHVNAAQAPLSVVNIGAASRRTVFAYGSGQVVDTTSDGGRRWYQALFQGLSMALVPGPQGHLVAFIDGSSNGKDVTRQYVSKNGGRSWTHDAAIGGS